VQAIVVRHRVVEGGGAGRHCGGIGCVDGRGQAGYTATYNLPPPFAYNAFTPCGLCLPRTTAPQWALKHLHTHTRAPSHRYRPYRHATRYRDYYGGRPTYTTMQMPRVAALQLF